MTISKLSIFARVVHAENDRNFFKGVRAYTDLLKKKGVPVELHLFEKGGHGYGLRQSSILYPNGLNFVKSGLTPYSRNLNEVIEN